MPSWGEILKEIQQSAAAQGGAIDLDTIRRKYIRELSGHTRRNVILYATRWIQTGPIDPNLVSIVPEDVHGLMEVVHGLDYSIGLDLIMHSPGGSPDAAEAIVHYLREKFPHIRVIVPQAAMSAATMIACAADEIVMGAHSSLGPIDPQLIMGQSIAPAQAILDQFERALKECADPKNLGAWLPILQGIGPALLVQCKDAQDLAEGLAAEWLSRWMLKSDVECVAKSKTIAKALADHTSFKSHGRSIHRGMARKLGLHVTNLEDDQRFQDLVLSVFHSTMHVFSMNGAAAKIIENQNGAAFVKMQQLLQFQMPLSMPMPPQAPPASPADASEPLIR